jgi:hypothetical protein
MYLEPEELKLRVSAIRLDTRLFSPKIMMKYPHQKNVIS